MHSGYVDFVARWEPLLAAVPEEPSPAVRAAFEASADLEQVSGDDPLLPAELVPDDFAGPRARQLFIELMDALARHEIIARANVFGAYRAAVDTALAADQDDFWLKAFLATSRPKS